MLDKHEEEQFLQFTRLLAKALNTDPSAIANLPKQIRQMREDVDRLVNEDRDKALDNNITFSWDGPTTTISWNSGHVKDRWGKSYRVLSGSRVLAAETGYWVGWNPVHETMSFSTSLSDLTNIPNILRLAGITTGTAAQTGDAGGGGTDPGGDGISGGRYAGNYT